MEVRILFLEVGGKLIQRYRRARAKLRGYNLGDGVILERNLNLDRVYPNLISIGANTLIASGTTILSHEHIYREDGNSRLPKKCPVVIGENCFIGVGATILPNVTIGASCVIGAGTVVTRDIPSNSMVVGVPAKIIRKVWLNESTYVVKEERL